MTIPRQRLFALTLLLLFAMCSLPARGQTTAIKNANANGVITGRVTSEDGKGVANVAVALLPADFDPRRGSSAQATTDADGYYRLVRVPAGRFRVRAVAPLYFVPAPGDNNRFNGGKTVNLVAGETVEHIDLTLARGGVITGRVADADGKPAIAQRINIFFAAVADPQARSGKMSNATSQSSFETDDRGVYRVYGLMPGRYLVSVGEGEGGIRYGNAGATYPRTFHPGVAEEAQAQAVEVTAGGEATGVDIALADAAKTFTARGRVVDADTGQPLANSSVSYNTFISGDLRGGGYGGSTDAKGEFRIKHLLPGSYAASVRPDYADGGAATDDNFYSDVAPFEIVDADATGLEIKVHRGASISGVVVLDNTQARAVLAKLPQLGLYARQLKTKPDQRSMAFGSLSRVNADGTFHLAGLRPGKVQLALNSSSAPPRGFTLTRVERNGVEVGSDGFDLAAGEQLTGVRVHLAYGNGTLRGQVETREGAAAAALPANVRLGVRVYRAGEADSHVQPVGFAEVDARGRFVVESLLGGGYDLVVFGYFTAPPVGRLPDARQSINVADNGETNVTISYDLSAGRDKEQQP